MIHSESYISEVMRWRRVLLTGKLKQKSSFKYRLVWSNPTNVLVESAFLCLVFMLLTTENILSAAALECGRQNTEETIDTSVKVIMYHIIYIDVLKNYQTKRKCCSTMKNPHFF